MGHPLGSNLTLLFLSFTSFNKGSFSYISDKKPVSISIKETDYFLKIFRSREVARIGHLLALSGICQPRTLDTHAVSYQNITTLRILLEKKAHLSRTGKN